jgi:hypothetical protein
MKTWTLSSVTSQGSIAQDFFPCLPLLEKHFTLWEETPITLPYQFQQDLKCMDVDETIADHRYREGAELMAILQRGAETDWRWRAGVTWEGPVEDPVKAVGMEVGWDWETVVLSATDRGKVHLVNRTLSAEYLPKFLKQLLRDSTL